MNFIIQSVH